MSEQLDQPTPKSYLNIEEKINAQLRKQQDIGFAIVGGIAAALVGAAIWALITVSTELQIGYMAVGVGLLVGFSVRFFGAGVDIVYSIIGAVCALLGCLLGNLFSQVWFIAEMQGIGYFQTLGFINLDFVIILFQETFSFIDVLFYGIAIYEGFKFARRTVSDEMIEQYNASGTIAPQAYGKLRLPIAIVCFVSIGVLWYVVSREDSGLKTYTYESGNKMSEGEYVDGKEDGAWSYWYDSGPLQATGNYKNGIEEGEWKWFNEEGIVIKKGSYQFGLQEGAWVTYYNNGIASDSGSYSQGRKTGEWVYKYETGVIGQHGKYERDLAEGVWETFYPDGKLSSKGSYTKNIRLGRWQYWYENGKISQEVDYLSQYELNTQNAWDKNGKQLVTAGNGIYYTVNDNGIVIEEIHYKDGKQNGKWVSYYDNGSKREEGEYKNDLLYTYSTWSPDGEVALKDGNGTYQLYADNGETVEENGELKAGLREGIWVKFYETVMDTLQITTYLNGKITGPYKTFFSDGTIQSEGAFIDGKLEGEWNWYYQTGGLESQANFINGKKNGVQTFWSENGIALKEEEYSDDNLKEVRILNQEND